MDGRRIFTVGDVTGVAIHAGKLAEVIYPDSHVHVMNIDQKNCMQGLRNDALKSLVFLGHANTEEYGGYTAQQFAGQLAGQFEEDQKKLVEHFYLLGCDVGLIRSDGQSVAQAIANELFKKGFINSQIHSIAKPDEAVGDALYVEVIERVGKATFTQPILEGYINAFLLHGEDAEKFEQLSENKKINYREIQQIKNEKAFHFVKNAHPIRELNKPHHIFIPNEKLEMRKKRIAEHPYTYLSKEQIQAIQLLRHRRDYEYEKNDKTLVRKLNLLITQLGRVPPEDWQSLVERFVPYFQIGISGITLNKTSNTLKLLAYLSEDNFIEAQKIIDVQHSKPKKNKVNTKHQRVDGDDPHGNTEIRNELKLKETLQLIHIKKKIDELITDLNSEIADLSSHCFSFCNRYEVTTKIQKKDALTQLKNMTSLQALQLQAADFMLSDLRVMRSEKTTRTRDLLDKIVNKLETFTEEWRHDVRVKYNQ